MEKITKEDFKYEDRYLEAFKLGSIVYAIEKEKKEGEIVKKVECQIEPVYLSGNRKDLTIAYLNEFAIETAKKINKQVPTKELLVSIYAENVLLKLKSNVIVEYKYKDIILPVDYFNEIYDFVGAFDKYGNKYNLVDIEEFYMIDEYDREKWVYDNDQNSYVIDYIMTNPYPKLDEEDTDEQKNKKGDN